MVIKVNNSGQRLATNKTEGKRYQAQAVLCLVYQNTLIKRAKSPKNLPKELS